MSDRSNLVAGTVADLKTKGWISDVCASLLIEANNKDRESVAELLEAARIDFAMPNTITISYRDDWAPGEPEGPDWWAWRRAQLDAAGYSMAFEYNDGRELFYRDSTTPRLVEALAKFGATP